MRQGPSRQHLHLRRRQGPQDHGRPSHSPPARPRAGAERAPAHGQARARSVLRDRRKRRAAQEERKAKLPNRPREGEPTKRRDRALLLRYPSRAVHDQERNEALAQVDEVIKAASKRTLELAEQRKAIQAEFEFYAKDPSKAPPRSSASSRKTTHSSAVQNRSSRTRSKRRSA
jgi:hypothetical protein